MKKLKLILIGIVVGGVIFGGATYLITKHSDDKMLIQKEETIDSQLNKINTENASKNNQGKTISDEQAKQIIFKKVPNGNLVEFGYEDDETPSYDGKIIKDNVEYEFSIDAKTGEIIKLDEDFEPDYRNNKDIKAIGEDSAKDIMLKKVGGGKLIEFEFDKDDRVPKYEGTILKDNMEYDVSVNAETGKIIGFSKEHYDGN